MPKLSNKEIKALQKESQLKMHDLGMFPEDSFYKVKINKTTSEFEQAHKNSLEQGVQEIPMYRLRYHSSLN